MAYSYYRAITIDNTKAPSTQTNFPVLISGTYAYLATVANGGNVQSASGHDIAFYSDSALTTQLKHEIEKWEDTTGAVLFWVKVPSVSSSTPTVIYMAYGDASVVTSQADKTNVWDSNFKGVWHLREARNTTSGNYLDSTAAAINGTLVDADSDTVQGTGKIGNAVNFAGDADYIDLGTQASLNLLNDITVSAWVNPDTIGTNQPTIFDRRSTDWGYYMSMIDIAGSKYLRWAHVGAAAYDSTANAVSAGSLQHVCCVHNDTANTVSFYVNGAFVVSRTAANLTTISAAARIGASVITAGRNFDGVIDEVRISNTVRSANWITTEYNNQNSPSTFYSVGSQVSTSGSAKPPLHLWMFRTRSFHQ